MLDLLPIHIDAVIIIFRVHNETTPFPPTWWDVRSVVLVQILAKVPSAIARIREICGEGASFVRGLPLWTRAVVVVGEDHVIMHVHSG